jgi:hypothetical protein
MAGTAPTDFQFTKTLDAAPLHCSVWLGGALHALQFSRDIEALPGAMPTR